jgi:hypothetical protein
MRTHLQSKTRLYSIWAGMKKRCTNKKANNYHLYGGRGIIFYKEWNNFEPFQRWALANGYNDSVLIDRRDVDGNYEPSNCRWLTLVESANNKRNNIYIEYEGERLALAVILRAKGLSHKYSVIRNRITKLGWSIDDALTDKAYSKYKIGGINKKSKVVIYNGNQYALIDLLRQLNLVDKYHTVKARMLKLGWPIEKAIKFKNI